MLNQYITVKTAIIVLLICTFGTILTNSEISKQSDIERDRDIQEQEYKDEVGEYKECLIIQSNRIDSNARADVIRDFLSSARKARLKEGNLETADEYLKLKLRTKDVKITYCVRPIAPEGVKPILLPSVPSKVARYWALNNIDK